MGLKIEINGLDIGGDAEFLNGARIEESGDIDISVKNLNIAGKLEMLNDLQLNALVTELREKTLSMNRNSEEYGKLQEILREKKWDKANFIKRIGEHIASFSEGVLASMLAGILMQC